MNTHKFIITDQEENRDMKLNVCFKDKNLGDFYMDYAILMGVAVIICHTGFYFFGDKEGHSENKTRLFN
jgi:hypothetical protein